MPLKKILQGLPSDVLSAEGILEMDWAALTACQRECTSRLGMTVQLEQEAYLTQHPEIRAMLEVFIAKMAACTKRREMLKQTTQHFTRPVAEIEAEVRARLQVEKDGPYIKENQPPFSFDDYHLPMDLRNIILKHYPEEKWVVRTPSVETPDTVSSSFISIITSQTTQPTPEPVKTPDPTLSEIMFNLVSNTVDKAIYSRVDDNTLRYDTAYVELTKAVEEAMEIPVIEIKLDIADLFFNAYRLFELNILEKERQAAEIAWEKRMRKKLKRTLRRQNNFKGYETPPTPKSELSSHESYKKPPPKPCKCHPQFNYNRYPKDRFGIYLPRDDQYNGENVTATPALQEEEEENRAVSVKSTASASSRRSDRFGIYLPRDDQYNGENVTATPALQEEEEENRAVSVKSTASASSRRSVCSSHRP